MLSPNGVLWAQVGGERSEPQRVGVTNMPSPALRAPSPINGRGENTSALACRSPPLNASVIASEAKQSSFSYHHFLDCFVATLLAMTAAKMRGDGGESQRFFVGVRCAHRQPTPSPALRAPSPINGRGEKVPPLHPTPAYGTSDTCILFSIRCACASRRGGKLFW